MSALASAMLRARAGLTWEYPCLVWIADYLRDATGRDPAAQWRAIAWDENTAHIELQKLAAFGQGDTDVERALHVIAKRDGWTETDSAHQGAIMVGVFTSQDGIGVPAIFDGEKRWIVSTDGRGWRSLKATPKRIWEIPA